MAEITTSEIRAYLKKIQGRVTTLKAIRTEFNILPGRKSFDAVRNILFQLAEQKVVRPTGRNDGSYKVITEVHPVPVFGVKRERKPPFELKFPKDFDTGMTMDFAFDIVIREGDLILIGGVSNFGKTALAMNLCGENIDSLPVLMGNEYTTPDEEPTPRFLTRLDNMDWVQWTNGDGSDKFSLLPVRDDYAEHIVKDKINIIDWINMPSGEYYLINTIMDNIKRQIGRGLAIIVLQKAEGTDKARGGQMTKDFTDCELLLDKMNNNETLLTIGKVKEYTHPVMGKTYAFSIRKGVRITNFREVKRCKKCYGKGHFSTGGECQQCLGLGFTDV